MLRSSLLALIVALASPAFAQEIDDGFCRNGGFPSENNDFGVSVVTSARAYFLEDMNGCPNTEARCRQKSYVIKGNEVLTGRTKGDYVCAYFPNKAGGSAGWVQRSQVKALPIEKNPSLAAWLGWWSADGNPTARFKRSGKRLYLESEAFWPGPDREKDWPAGWPHEGGADGPLDPRGNHAHFSNTEQGCEADFTFLGKYLVAADNGECGGANVRLDGVYQRDKHAKFLRH